ncbi:hypothetical protein H5410_021749 [Solanum commersonii]|uniref:Uncharacterized protein n=1 Tax=Solanum commersonii TaxID=4109 RepID=A0A9J5ZG57_SOLCO|nr:hypothetical protein H5410_021749 [Solanum commersonii]
MEWLVITNETFLRFQGKVKIKNKNRSFKYSKLNGKMTGSETYRSVKKIKEEKTRFRDRNRYLMNSMVPV